MLSRLKTKRTERSSSRASSVHESEGLSPSTSREDPGNHAHPATAAQHRAMTAAAESHSLLVPASPELHKRRSASMGVAAAPDRRSLNLSMPEYHPQPGPGQGSTLNIGDGNLSLNLIAPELRVAYASPTDTTPPQNFTNGFRSNEKNGGSEDDDEAALLTPMPNADTRFDLTRASFSNPTDTTTLPLLSRENSTPSSSAYSASAATVQSSVVQQSPQSTRSRSNTASSSDAPSIRVTSRPGSRSASVNSQDLLSPESISRVRSLSPGRKETFGSSVGKSLKKSRSSNGMSGIAGALALSGVALATPSPHLRQPIHLARQTSATPVSAPNGTSNPNGEPSSTVAQCSPPLAVARDSTDVDSSDGHSAFGDERGHMLSMDALGDFDDVVSQLGTGYAVASSKRNADFHSIFKAIPDDDYLIEDYGCALQREILIQGRLYISEHHLSFNANIFGWVTTHTLPFAEIVSIEKRMTAYVIPNAIQVTTLHARYTFASFLSRDTTYDLIGNIWRMVHPVVPTSAGLPDGSMSSSNFTTFDRDDSDAISIGSSSHHETADEGAKRAAIKRLVGLRRRAQSTVERDNGSTNDKSSSSGVGTGSNSIRPGTNSPRGSSPKMDRKVHAVTEDKCALLRNLSVVCMDSVFPSAPEKIYNLMFTSGFMKDFWVNNQKLMELQISDWAPEKTGSHLLARSMSYIKPLTGSVGPKQTKCLLTDESAHVDFDDYVCIITTTRTPDVPSGGKFCVKTRTSMTWAKGNSCRVRVTTGCEWTGGSMLKGIIERSCIEGQKSYHVDLEREMRAYIQAHRSEFLEEGQDASDSQSLNSGPASPSDEDASSHPLPGESSSSDRQDQGGMLKMVLDTIGDILGGLGLSPATAGLAFIVLVLVLSNLWTLSSRPRNAHLSGEHRAFHPSSASSSLLSSSGAADASTRRGGQRNPDEIALAVRGVLQDYFSNLEGRAGRSGGEGGEARSLPEQVGLKVPLEDSLDPAEEMAALVRALDEIEARVLRLRGALEELA